MNLRVKYRLSLVDTAKGYMELLRDALHGSSSNTFKKSLNEAMRFNDFIHAGKLRRSVGTDVVIPENPTIEALEHLNKWYRDHANEANPHLKIRADLIEKAEVQFAKKWMKTHGKTPTARMAVARTGMMYRRTMHEVARTAEQIELSNPEVGTHFPYMEYVTADDFRVRPTHSDMDGFVALREWEGWKTILPPCGYNCRCSVILRTWRHGIRHGWASDKDKPKWETKWPSTKAKTNYKFGHFPDDGWDGPKYVAI